jgi:hypothetical protein
MLFQIYVKELARSYTREDDMTSEHATNKSRLECKNCRIVKFFGDEVAECQKKLDCQWAIVSGYGHFCKHPSSLKSSSNLNRLFN